jgi:hypothetical protein
MREHGTPESHRRRRFRIATLLGVGVLAASVSSYAVFAPSKNLETSSSHSSEQQETYPVHSDITATIFWVGEGATPDSGFIHNQSSAWVDDWQSAYGGVDDPDKRCGHFPCGFTPKENPFYFALPYNDLDETGVRKESARNIPWYSEAMESNPTSVVKNRWIKITHNDRSVYAQWEDAGPTVYDDFEYVFGDKPPSFRAGLDLSPATGGLLGLDGQDTVSWHFVDAKDVPDGPWKQIITTSN